MTQTVPPIVWLAKREMSMSEPRVNAVLSLELDVFDLAQSVDFYRQAWGLDDVKTENGSAYLRATGPHHHVLALHERPRAGFARVNLGAPDRAAVDALHAKIKAAGATIVAEPGPLPGQSGGGYGFEVQSPEGQRVRIACDVATHADAIDDPSRPTRINHVVLNAARMDEQMAFFCDLLGFKLSDNNGFMNFIRCSRNHHSIALAQSEGPSLNHAAFEMADFDALMQGVGRLRLQDHEIGWGVGRHAGPGRNIFSYFVDPNGFAIEYTTDVDQVDDTYVTRHGDYWRNLPLRPCSWAGTKTAPTPWMAEAMGGKIVAARNAACDDVISEKMAG